MKNENVHKWENEDISFLTLYEQRRFLEYKRMGTILT